MPYIMGVFRQGPLTEESNRMQWGMNYEKSRFSTNISLYLWNNTRWGRSYYTIFNDLERPTTKIPRSRHYLTMIISETVQDTDIVEYYRDLYMPYSRVSFQMTLSDLEWLSEIFSGTKHRAVSLRQLSFLVHPQHLNCLEKLRFIIIKW